MAKKKPAAPQPDPDFDAELAQAREVLIEKAGDRGMVAPHRLTILDALRQLLEDDGVLAKLRSAWDTLRGDKPPATM